MTIPNENYPDADHSLESVLSRPQLAVAERMANLMLSHGVGHRQQTGLLCQICGLSVSQARRKLQGASWSFEEVLEVAQHFGASLDELFIGVRRDSSGVEPASSSMLEALFYLADGIQMPCQVALGLEVTKFSSEQLVATLHDGNCFVGLARDVLPEAFVGKIYHPERVVLHPLTVESPSSRIAVLDDDADTTSALCEWFSASGYQANGFTSSGKLLEMGLDMYDAFVVDFLLAAGDSSVALAHRIREALPHAPILLLTGNLRRGLPPTLEAELAGLLRMNKVVFLEKPVRPSVLAATIDKELAVKDLDRGD